jgi:hypothetical protein
LKSPKILYFTESYSPTVADQLAVVDLGISVSFRNATFAGGDAGVEPCDGVMGAVPSNYEHLPSGEDALKAYKTALKKLHSGLGESLAPNKAPKAEAEAKAPVDGADAPAWNAGKK